MIDVFQVADLLVSHAVETYGEEIDIVGYYGSHAQGTASDRSDLDIFYIPADGKNPPVNRAVLIDGILFDFWPITWDTMERFASGHARGWAHAPALVYHAKVLYSRSDTSAARLADLKQRVVDLQQPESRPQMIRRAQEQFRDACMHLGKLRLAVASDSVADVRHVGWHLIGSVLECLALMNQVFFDRGGGHIMEQLSRLQVQPENLAHLITVVSTAADSTAIAEAAEALARGTRHLLCQYQPAHAADSTASNPFHNAYPEINDQIQKVLSACEQQHGVAASFAAWCVQHEVSLMLAEFGGTAGLHPDVNFISEYSAPYRSIGLPNLIGDSFSDMHTVAEHAALFDSRLRRWLCEQSVGLDEYSSVGEFAQSLPRPRQERGTARPL